MSDDTAMQSSFEGQIDGQSVASFRGTVERAGYDPYLLLGVFLGDDPWILDMGGVGVSGPCRAKVALVAPDDRRFTGETETTVSEPAGGSLSVDVAVDLHGPDGEVKRLQGRFQWDAERSVHFDGEVAADLDGHRIGPTQTQLSPFEGAWQMTAIIPVAAGETHSLSLQVPAAGDGEWLHPQVTLALTVTRMTSDSGVQINTFHSDDLAARGALEGDELAVVFQGTLRVEGADDAPAARHITGRFTGSRVS